MENNDINRLFKKAQILADDIQRIESFDVDAAFRKMEHRVRSDKRRRMIDSWMRYAAFFTLPLLITSFLFAYLYFEKKESPVQFAEVTASAGSILRYELPDKSVVWLNAGSTLRYPIVFSADSRNVDLKGEAYFEVKADKEHPFYVNTPAGLQVYVHGTRFDVSAYEDDAHVTTVLESGKVNVVTPAEKTLELKPGEELYYDKTTGTWTQRQVDVCERTAWKDGRMVFRNMELAEILKRLSRHFNVDIVLNNPKGQTLKYWATFRMETLPQILNYLSKSTAMKWSVEESVRLEDETLTKAKYTIDLY